MKDEKRMAMTTRAALIMLAKAFEMARSAVLMVVREIEKEYNIDTEKG